MRKLCAIIALVVGAGLLPGSALAQSYPNRPVRIIVPFVAGGAVDLLARLMGTKLTESFGQPVIIENRAGAGGNAGAEAVAKAAPDGYTILLTVNGLAISPSVYRKLAFDVEKDFIPVTQLLSSQLLLVASPKLPATSTQELIALAKSKPGSLNYGSTGPGNPLSLTMEMLKHAAGIEVQPVPYRGDAPLNAALIAGEVDMAVVPMATALGNIEGGRLRALAICGARRSPALPNVPTVAEGGLPGFDSTSWQGFFVPANTPREVVLRIQRDSAKALAAPDVVERVKSFGAEPLGSTPEEFAARFKADIAKFAKIVKDANIPAQD